MTDTFTWSVDENTEGDVTFRLRTAQFGDGYSQVVADGLNAKIEQWSVVISDLYADEMAPITAFLDSHVGESFYWTPPDGTQGLYRCTQYKKTPKAANLRTITATFQQVFVP